VKSPAALGNLSVQGTITVWVALATPVPHALAAATLSVYVPDAAAPDRIRPVVVKLPT
jgi:hypothetical protein